jgi:hypothetical protein
MNIKGKLLYYIGNVGSRRKEPLKEMEGEVDVSAQELASQLTFTERCNLIIALSELNNEEQGVEKIKMTLDGNVGGTMKPTARLEIKTQPIDKCSCGQEWTNHNPDKCMHEPISQEKDKNYTYSDIDQAFSDGWHKGFENGRLSKSKPIIEEERLTYEQQMAKSQENMSKSISKCEHEWHHDTVNYLQDYCIKCGEYKSENIKPISQRKVEIREKIADILASYPTIRNNYFNPMIYKIADEIISVINGGGV